MFHQIRRNKVTDLSLVYQSLVGPQTALRAEAARYLGSHGDEASVPHLIDALRDQTCHVGAKYPSAGMATTRFWANDSLKRLTGEDFGFVWEDPIGERDQAVSRWRDWYEGTHKGR